MIPSSRPRPTAAADLVTVVAAEVGDALHLESVTVVGDTSVLVRWGAPSRPGTEVDLRHCGELVGLLQVTTWPGRTLSAHDRAVLRALATVAAAAVVMDRDVSEARRNVQDRIAPTLAGIGLGMEGVRNLVLADPAAGLELLRHLQTELQTEVAAATASIARPGSRDPQP